MEVDLFALLLEWSPWSRSVDLLGVYIDWVIKDELTLLVEVALELQKDHVTVTIMSMSTSCRERRNLLAAPQMSDVDPRLGCKVLGVELPKA